MFNGYSEVPAEMLKRRAVVMARKEPRSLLIQPHMQATVRCSISDDARVLWQDA
jgi:hypothetical protein